MSTDLFKIKNGIKLKPNSTTLDAEGEIKYNGSGNLILRDGSGEKTVLDEDNSVAVTNKTIVVASNTITTASSGNLAATELNTALAELQTDIDTRALDSALTDHISDATDAHDASAISSVASGNLAATDVQAALNELQSDIDTRALASGLSDHLSDTADAHDASAISNSPSGNLVATDVQAALNELQTEIDTHLADTAEHGATGAVVGTTNSQTLTNKTLTAPIIDVASLTEQGSSPATPSAGTKKFYAKTDGKLYTLDSSGNEIEVGSGAGGGGVYYINQDFETGVTSLVTYADAAGTSPVDATGGSPNITVTEETSAPLIGEKSAQIAKDAANRQGEGVAIVSSTIDAAYEDKVHVVEFLWKTDSNYADGDMSLWVVHPTTGTVEALYFRDAFGNYSNELPQSASTVLKVISEISPIDPTYKVVIHVASTSATAYEVFVDNIQAGPQKLIPGAIVTQPQAWTPTFTAGVTLGNGVFTNSQLTRVGSWVHGSFEFTLGTTSAITGEISFSHPYPIDTTKMTETLATQYGYGQAVGTTRNPVVVLGGTVFTIRPVNASSTYDANGTAMSSTVPFTWATGHTLNVMFSYPVEGWDSGALISSTQADFNTLQLRYQVSASSANLSFADASGERVDFDSEIYNTHPTTVTTGASWLFTAPIAGKYRVTAGLDWTNQTNMTRTAITVEAGGVDHNIIDYYTTMRRISGSTIVELSAGDTIAVRGFQDDSAGAARTIVAGTGSFIVIERVPDFSTFGVFPEKNRIQTKLLSANVTSNTTASDLTFSNLTIGKWYDVKGQFRLRLTGSGGDNLVVTATHNATTVGLIKNLQGSTVTTEQDLTFATNFSFQATATTLTFVTTGCSANDILAGDGTRGQTYVQLEERNDLRETSAW